jgi:Transglutaminase-like superfamily
MTTQEQILDFYSAPGAITSAGRYGSLFERLPNDIGALVRIVQGLALHEFVAPSMYSITVSDERKNESHIREAERMFDRILELDNRPFHIARPPERRLVGVCRHFVVLLLAMLRAKHIPCRCRSGFASYFSPGFWEDHVVCEYWNAAEKRWMLADPQFDETWRRASKVDHDILDVPRDRFLIAADAWALCQTGRSEPARFGTVNGNLRGLWFIAASLVHDLSDLNKMEMLRWDVWGAMPHPDAWLKTDDLAFFKHLAALTRQPDESFEQQRRLYEDDSRLRVPPTVFNALRNRPESALSPAA